MAPFSRISRGGFTLVELLVVIVIISMLIAMLIPAVTSARARARQTQCNNNQRNLAQAVLQYEMAKKRFPGYANPNGTSSPITTAFSWPVVLFKQLGRNDLADEWRSHTSGCPEVHVDLLVCPSDDIQGDAPLSYVGNCGWINESGNFNASTPSVTGVFLDRSGFTTPLPSLAMSDIRDGAQHTLLLAERRNPDEDESNNTNYRQWADTAYATMKRNTGFIWQGDNGTTGVITEMDFHISSYHPGGINVSFCDGHQHFLSEEVNYNVYQKLMTPNGTGMVLVEGEAAAPPQLPLNGGDY